MIKIPGVGSFDFENKDRATLLRFYTYLDLWVWPKDLPYKPFLFDEMKDYFNSIKIARRDISKSVFVLPILEAISNIVGFDNILKFQRSKTCKRILSNKDLRLKFNLNRDRQNSKIKDADILT